MRDPNLLTTSEAATLLEVSDDTVIRMADARELPCERTRGGHRRFRRLIILAVRDGRPIQAGRDM